MLRCPGGRCAAAATVLCVAMNRSCQGFILTVQAAFCLISCHVMTVIGNKCVNMLILDVMAVEWALNVLDYDRIMVVEALMCVIMC